MLFTLTNPCLYVQKYTQNSAQLELMFGLIELEYRFRGGGSGNPNFFFIFYLVRLWLGCIPKISLIACLEVPQKFVWVVVVVESKLSDWL